ncbi:lysophospholipid acyltransferase family protein [Kineococcus sp. SYSU DK005]|uniref:lysophospholipid acyltransferase family protein n=1 Tax=Kineococcus sp. SYSU DK005 TaxID=3383126 RepID=UPI003D7E6A00
MTMLVGEDGPGRLVRAFPLARRRRSAGSAAGGGAGAPGGPGGGGPRKVHRNDWVRSRPASAVRAGLQRALLTPLMRAEVRIEVRGAEVLDALGGPAVIVANHSSHLDTPVLLEALGPRRRRRVAVAAAADYFFDVWWRSAPSGLVIGTFPLDRRGGPGANASSRLLADGWSLVIFPEGGRSYTGEMRPFKKGAAYLALEAGVPVVPVALRGTFEAMPPRQNWPTKGRPRIGVTFGEPLHGKPGERAGDFTPRIEEAVAKLLANS